MRYSDLKQIQKEISKLKAKIETLRESAESTTQTLSDMPTGGVNTDKVGNAVIKIQVLSERVECLNRKLSYALSLLPDSLEAHCIILKVKRKYSWIKISHIVGGNEESVKKACYRYKW